MTYMQYVNNECQFGGKIIQLTPQETELVCYLLIKGPSQLSTTEELIEIVWPNPDKEPDYANSMIGIHIFKCRKKGVPIKAEWGRGYYIETRTRHG